MRMRMKNVKDYVYVNHSIYFINAQLHSLELKSE